MIKWKKIQMIIKDQVWYQVYDQVYDQMEEDLDDD